jgi:quercetin dioxygenase-like cupin family protein
MPIIDIDGLPEKGSHGESVRFFNGANMEIVVGPVSAGMTAPPASHLEEQVTVVLKGAFELRVGGETRHVAAGDVFLVAPWEEHELVATLEDSLVLDVFSPPRSAG